MSLDVIVLVYRQQRKYLCECYDPSLELPLFQKTASNAEVHTMLTWQEVKLFEKTFPNF